MAYADVFVPMALSVIFQLLKDKQVREKYRGALAKLYAYIGASGVLNVE